MKTNSLDLQGNSLKNFKLSPVTNFPAVPDVGTFIFKDRRVMICVEIDAGLPIWVPLTAQVNTHIHTQAVAATTWTIDHDLNSSNTIVQIIDATGKHITPDEVTQTFDQTVVTFITAQSGRAILMLGQEEGYDRPDYSYTQSFDTPSTTWVVTHMLGHAPAIRVFIGNAEVQPLSIVHDTVNQTTVTFSTPQTGLVRAL